MAWVFLIVAGLFEVVWSTSLKQGPGILRPVALCVTILGMGASVGFLGLALRTLPLGAAYAVWTGIGVAGTTALGILLYGETLGAGQIACIILIIAGAAGLKFLSAS